MEDIKSVRILRHRFGIGQNEYEDFEEKDIIKIRVTNYSGEISEKTLEGKIIWIDTSYIEVDCSTQYESFVRKIDFKNICQIDKIKNS